MLTTSNHKELFRTPSTGDKLTFFQLLLDAGMLTADISLALLKIIHKELSADKEYDRSHYKRYALSISALHYYMPDVFEYVIDTWKNTKP